ncbi:MAG: thiamine-phosphate kinase [Gammaproteobacteria bacterium]|nr:thiamine-phosphate kinase [Gammaproteobacteria bacterium]
MKKSNAEVINSEFELIQRYFQYRQENREDVILGIGDDAALLETPVNKYLAISIDTLIEGVHFPLPTSAADIAYKALAVNLSDMAAMGAQPAWFTLALTLPEVAIDWLEAFSQSLFEIANQYKIALVGGDTTRGSLAISIQIGGYVDRGNALLRSGARVGDKIFVTGTLGDAALGLYAIQNNKQDVEIFNSAIQSLNRPVPRVQTGLNLHTIASACIDISDGLFADLGHILEASHVGAKIELNDLPLSCSSEEVLLSYPELKDTVMKGGDDYELCFTVAPENISKLDIIEDRITCIGEIVEERNLTCVDKNKNIVSCLTTGFDHFS